ncbi:hypothetical protein JCM8202_005976 [Rhodotorula sphaerocarpa]
MPARSSSLAFKACLVAAAVIAASGPAHAYQYTVGVGKDQSTGQPGIGFDPSRTQIVDQNTVNTIVFTFLEGIHRVVQTDGSLNAPCSPAGQFDTGVQTVPAGSNGPSFTFSVDNNTAEYYFADIGEDYSPCYLGAVFCVNTDESSSSTSCHAVQSAAISLGKQQGVSTTPGLSTASASSTADSSSTGSSSMSMTMSSSSAPMSSAPSSSASRSATASAANNAASSKPTSAAAPGVSSKSLAGWTAAGALAVFSVGWL